MSQLFTNLVRSSNHVRLRVRKEIEGAEWSFPKGKLLHGTKDRDGTWRVWPPGQDFAFICGVPSRYVRRAKPSPHDHRKPNNKSSVSEPAAGEE